MTIDDIVASNSSPDRQATLCFIRKDDHILLAMKKRGFGKGRWNGLGGKIKHDESIIDAAKRETHEEIGVHVDDLTLVAILDFYFPHQPDWNQQVIVYETKKWEGNPTESEEMKPKWHHHDNIPYDEMWTDDILWLPHILKGKKVRGYFIFTKDESVQEHAVNIVDKLTLR